MRSTDNVPLRRARDARARHASPEAVRQPLDEVLARHEPRVRSLLMRLVGDSDRAEVVTRTVLRRAVRELPRLRDERAWVWLFRLTTEVALAESRQKLDPLLEDRVYGPRDAGWIVLRGLSAAERRAVLSAAANALRAPDGDVAYLRYAERLPHTTIRRVLDSDGARRSLDRLRKDLGRELDRRLLS